jgi:PAS domain S-box-containing protein
MSGPAEGRQDYERIRQLFQQAPGVICILRGPTHIYEFVNHSYQRLVGDRELLGKTVLEAVPEIAGQGFIELLDNVYRTGEPFTAFGAKVKLRRRPNGPLEDRFVDFIYQPMVDEKGEVTGIFVEAFDITDRIESERALRASEERWKAASNRMQVMVAELQHRTRNLVAVVKAVADRTLQESQTLEDFRALYGDRLGAVSRVQGLLSRLAEGERITFDQVLQAELSALAAFAETSARVSLEGPNGIGLRSNTVQTLSLALHELLTNALKYGALAVPDGRLNIHWHLDAPRADQTRVLHVDWRESGVPMSAVALTAQSKGYGRELIERALPYQLMAQTSYDLGADGVRCTIDVPLSA